MQIIESTPFGVRSAIYRLETDDTAPDFIIFPMLHIATPDFYKQISCRLDHCDLILMEGVRSRITSLITLSYRLFANSTRLGLVSQSHMEISHLKDRLIHADVTQDAFERRWWGQETWLRFLLPVIAPIFGLYMRFFGTRKDIARVAKLNLRKSRNEVLEDVEPLEVIETILDWRDKRLIRVIDQHRLDRNNADLCIAIVFGAQHMRAVIGHLISTHGYRVTKAEWETVFTL